MPPAMRHRGRKRSIKTLIVWSEPGPADCIRPRLDRTAASPGSNSFGAYAFCRGWLNGRHRLTFQGEVAPEASSLAERLGRVHNLSLELGTSCNRILASSPQSTYAADFCAINRGDFRVPARTVYRLGRKREILASALGQARPIPIGASERQCENIDAGEQTPPIRNRGPRCGLCGPEN
jgi:hypothetical protein